MVPVVCCSRHFSIPHCGLPRCVLPSRRARIERPSAPLQSIPGADTLGSQASTSLHLHPRVVPASDLPDLRELVVLQATTLEALRDGGMVVRHDSRVEAPTRLEVDTGD